MTDSNNEIKSFMDKKQELLNQLSESRKRTTSINLRLADINRRICGVNQGNELRSLYNTLNVSEIYGESLSYSDEYYYITDKHLDSTANTLYIGFIKIHLSSPKYRLFPSERERLGIELGGNVAINSVNYRTWERKLRPCNREDLLRKVTKFIDKIGI